MVLAIPTPLVEEISKGRASLFLGAGASREAGFPTAEDLAYYIADKAGSPHREKLKGQSLDFVSQYFYAEKGYGEHWIREAIIRHLEDKHKEVGRPPSKAHEIITKIRWRTMFTTNYDRLMEIAYDSCPDAVQRLLPIYKPDPQILRHEPEEVRLIKLNGSTDEARRNTSHKLVLTFADQQDARSHNNEFYELLRQEGINGPIVFVGFRFVHPGAQAPASSPEFQLLRNLLREMGVAARYHFCVSPVDDSSMHAQLARKELSANKVEVIDAMFGTFAERLINLIETPTLALRARPPVTIPVGHAAIRIEASEYEKDRRHFEILGTYLDDIAAPSVADSLNGRENWASFSADHFIRRHCHDEFTAVIEKAIKRASKGNSEIVLFSASPGWGKTFLLRKMAIEYYNAGRPVIWLQPLSTIEVTSKRSQVLRVGTWDSIRIDSILSSIYGVAENKNIDLDSIVPIIIADNCPERTTEVLSLFRHLTHNNRRFVLIYGVRDNELRSIIAEHPLLGKRARQFQPEGRYDSTKEVRELIEFCTQHKVASIEEASQRDVVAQSIINERADAAIILALQVIFDKHHRPFSEIVRGIWESLRDDKDAQRLVIRVAALHQFGNNFYPRLYSLLSTFPPHHRARILEVYRVCLENSDLDEESEQEEPCVRTRHSLVAEHMIRVCEKTPAEIDDELLALVKCMTGNVRDLEIIRCILKRITDYKISLSSERKTEELFQVAAESTDNDWVVCQQFAKLLLKREEYKTALAWAEHGMESNPDYPPLQHTKGNVLRRWGMELLQQGQNVESERKFQEARKCFAFSRVSGDPDEYGYVTHLDMLRYLLQNEEDEQKKANLLAEGVHLYREGLREIPEERFRYFLEDRYHKAFDLTGAAVDQICKRIKEALACGKSSVYGSVFLAQQIYEDGEYDEAVGILKEQRRISDEGVLTWVKESEFHAREGHFTDAAKCIDSARRREINVENAEVNWALLYWDMLIAIAREDFTAARSAIIRLSNSGFYSRFVPRQSFPRGYIWRETARDQVGKESCSFKKHAKIWSGRVESIKPGGQYGRIVMRDIVGETLYIEFNPRYFRRRDYRKGDQVDFVITILPNRLRADDKESKPFANTIDDLFVPYFD